MDVIRRFATDPALEEGGVWFDIGEGARLKIARAGNTRYWSFLRELTRGKEREIKLGVIADEVLTAITNKAMARAVLLDWQGLSENGTPVPYSEAKAEELLATLPDFRRLVLGYAGEVEAYRRAEHEEAEKNSGRSSASTST